MQNPRLSPEYQLNRVLISVDRKLHTNAHQALKRFGIAVIKDASRNLKKNKRVVSGRLLNSLVFKVTKLKKSIRLMLSAPARSPETGFLYGQTIEHGFRSNPVAPSSDVIEAWMRKKNIKPTWRERDSKGRFKKVPEDRKYRNVAYWIARKIATDGFDKVPDNFLQNAIDKNMYILNQRLNNIFKD